MAAPPTSKKKMIQLKYDPPVTCREVWWRKDLKPTPIPGAYKTKTFVEEPVMMTYGRKSEGRKRDSNPAGKGELLLPGAYEQKDFLQVLAKVPASYSFKDVGRNTIFPLYFKSDKNILRNYPGMYEMQKYLSMTVEKYVIKHWMFRSHVKRLPTPPFIPKEGPGPGTYEILRPAVCASTSIFKSRTPRFPSSYTKVPGPGTYEKIDQYPLSDILRTLARNRGVVYSSQ